MKSSRTNTSSRDQSAIENSESSSRLEVVRRGGRPNRRERPLSGSMRGGRGGRGLPGRGLPRRGLPSARKTTSDTTDEQGSQGSSSESTQDDQCDFDREETPVSVIKDSDSKDNHAVYGDKENGRKSTEVTGEKNEEVEIESSTLSRSPPTVRSSTLIAIRPGEDKTVTVRITVLNKEVHPNLDTIPFRRRGARQMRSSPSSEHGEATLTGTPTGAQTVLGHDGNLFYCHVCKGFGDVVCCDACPHVYHGSCFPVGDPSRISLENDDDPWYCPDCINKKPEDLNLASAQKATRSRSTGMDKRAIKRKCPECQHSASDIAMEPCDRCGVYLHYPSCRGTDQDDNEDTVARCSTCRAEVVAEEEEEGFRKKRKVRKDVNNDEIQSRNEESDVTNSDDDEDDSSEDTAPDTPKRHQRVGNNLVNGDTVREEKGDIHSSDDSWHLANKRVTKPKPPSMSKKKRGRPPLRHHLMSSTKPNTPLIKRKRGRPPLTTVEKQERAKRAEVARKEKKRLKTSRTSSESFESPRGSPISSSSNGDTMKTTPLLRGRIGPNGIFRAIPAFFFFLADNRPKIERVLSRKKPLFNRLTKGLERNEMIAREAAVWWTKARSNEHRRYMSMSMHDYEERVVAWKEEKNIREMMLARDTDNEIEGDEVEEVSEEEGKADSSPEDDLLTYKNHQRLYIATSVGSKPFTPEPGKSNNRVILELLQDMRFHPLPMFNPCRSNAELGQADYGKNTIPFFDVHGPVATSVGDECLGCTRGWNHFCPVLQRRFPAVEHRARLQPPLSSLVATRIGLGVQKCWPENSEARKSATAAQDTQVDLFTERETPETIEAKNLAQIRNNHLTEPSSRADDIVQFVEEAVAMKVPEPPRPNMPTSYSEPAKKSSVSRGLLPTRARKKRDETTDIVIPIELCDDSNAVRKCGRCRTIIRSDTGCIQCRRAQLVINMSKQQSITTHSQQSHPPGSKKNDGQADVGFLKVSTVMCGRVNLKETNFDMQANGDKAVSSAMTNMRWTPNMILEPGKIKVPTPKLPSRIRHATSSAEDSSDESELVHSESEGSSSKKDEAEVPELKDGDDDSKNAKNSDFPSINSKGSSFDSEKVTITEHRFPLRGLRSCRLKETPEASGGDKWSEKSDRHEMAKVHQEEANDLQKRGLSIVCSGILLAMMRRDPLLLFAEPVPTSVAGYSKIVKEPIDFGKIRSRVLYNEYTTLGSFILDARLLCANALAFNPAGSIYAKTAKELYDVLEIMQKRASQWMSAIKGAHNSSFSWRRSAHSSTGSDSGDDPSTTPHDPFRELRKTWPQAVEIVESGDWARAQISADFMRTKENEFAYYGSLAVRRSAEAAEASLAPYPDTGGMYNPVVQRTFADDEALRKHIDDHVSKVVDPVQLKEIPTWREEAVIRILRRVQSRRIEGRISSENGCARCDGIRIEQEAKMAMTAEAVRWGRNKKKGELDTLPRVHESRLLLSTGLASAKARDKVLKEQTDVKAVDLRKIGTISDVSVSVRGSGIHGWGLFADQPFKKGVIVAEYIGEYISNPVADAREKLYQEQRIQDYQFRVDENLVIDATLRGGRGRYINHNCNPNCIAKIIDGDPDKHLKRVLIVSQRPIKAREEVTYDYQFPLELDLEERIPCNCGSLLCRGFMNWDLPEKGSKNRIARTQKRGGNMRDRIRRLGRPLKK